MLACSHLCPCPSRLPGPAHTLWVLRPCLSGVVASRGTRSRRGLGLEGAQWVSGPPPTTTRAQTGVHGSADPRDSPGVALPGRLPSWGGKGRASFGGGFPKLGPHHSRAGVPEAANACDGPAPCRGLHWAQEERCGFRDPRAGGLLGGGAAWQEPGQGMAPLVLRRGEPRAELSRGKGGGQAGELGPEQVFRSDRRQGGGPPLPPPCVIRWPL